MRRLVAVDLYLGRFYLLGHRIHHWLPGIALAGLGLGLRTRGRYAPLAFMAGVALLYDDRRDLPGFRGAG